MEEPMSVQTNKPKQNRLNVDTTNWNLGFLSNRIQHSLHGTHISFFMLGKQRYHYLNQQTLLSPVIDPRIPFMLCKLCAYSTVCSLCLKFCKENFVCRVASYSIQLMFAYETVTLCRHTWCWNGFGGGMCTCVDKLPFNSSLWKIMTDTPYSSCLHRNWIKWFSRMGSLFDSIPMLFLINLDWAF